MHALSSEHLCLCVYMYTQLLQLCSPASSYRPPKSITVYSHQSFQCGAGMPVHLIGLAACFTKSIYQQGAGECLELQDVINVARQHLTIASVPIGTADGREVKFVEALPAAARATEQSDLKVHVLLDAVRATRPSSGAQSVVDIAMQYLISI